MFGNFFGKQNIVELLLEHPIAKLSYSEFERMIIKKHGHIIFKLFGYPLGVSSRQRANIIIKYLKPHINENVLDIGCGIGYYSFELATKFNCQVDGIDIDADDIELANKIRDLTKCNNVNFKVQNVLELDFPDNTFDKIILSEVLEHIRNDRKALKDVCRVLKPHGYLIITVPYSRVVEEYNEQKAKKSRMENIEIKGGHVRNGYSLEYMSKILINTGFDIVENCYISKKFTVNIGFPFFLITYPISKLDMFCSGVGDGLIVKAKKRM